MTEKYTISSSIWPQVAEQLQRVMPHSKLPEGVRLVTSGEILNPVRYISVGKYPEPFVVIALSVSMQVGQQLINRGALNIVLLEEENLDDDLLEKLNTEAEWVKALKGQKA